MHAIHDQFISDSLAVHTGCRFYMYDLCNWEVTQMISLGGFMGIFLLLCFIADYVLSKFMK